MGAAHIVNIVCLAHKHLHTHIASLHNLLCLLQLLILQIYQPTEEEKQEDVTVVKESKEDMMKEYEAAALRLDKAKLVCSLLFKAFHCCLELFLQSFLGKLFAFSNS